MNRFSDKDKLNLAGAIVDITKGDPKSSVWFAQVCGRRPKVFKDKTREEDVEILTGLLKKVIERRVKIQE